MDSCGIWLIGALGSLATTVITGTRAIATGLAGSTGLLTEQDEMKSVGFVGLQRLVFGGHEIRNGSLIVSANEICEQNGSIKPDWIAKLKADLQEIDGRIRPGVGIGGGPAIERYLDRSLPIPKTCREITNQLQADLDEFRAAHDLKHIVVVNLSSTEPPTPLDAPYTDLKALEQALDKCSPGELRPGLLYAYAAFSAKCAYLNFTPSNSAICPATEALAKQHNLPYMGNDGKTGETLVKSALAPMFKYRNLKVDSWIGYNLLGNRDGEVLAEDENKQSKLDTKDSVLSSILGYQLQTHVGIDFVPSLKDNKVAWDYIHFRGFLDYPMSMQFTWHGCDSILAAPVVIDLLRLAELAMSTKQSGPLIHLASFFKSPIHCDQHDLHQQFHFLTDYLRNLSPSQ